MTLDPFLPEKPEDVERLKSIQQDIHRDFTALVKSTGTAVIVADHEHSGAVIDAAKNRGLHVMTVGRKGETLRLVDAAIDGFGQLMTIVYRDKRIRLRLPLVGARRNGDSRRSGQDAPARGRATGERTDCDP